MATIKGTGIHGEDPIRLYAELCEVVEEVIRHCVSEGRELPAPRTRSMQELTWQAPQGH